MSAAVCAVVVAFLLWFPAEGLQSTIDPQIFAEESAEEESTPASDPAKIGVGPKDRFTGTKPHIVYILADDLGYGSVGYNGAVQAKTPNIDKLAKGGTILDFFYTAPLCSPSRFSLMTGRHSFKCPTTFAAGNGDLWLPFGIPTGYVMLPKALKQAGYHTHLIGKWHLGSHRSEYIPTSRGFDTFYGFYGGSERHFEKDLKICREPKDNDHKKLHDWNEPNNLDESYNDESFVERAVNIIGKHDKRKPLFLVLSLSAPHGPLQAPERLVKQYGNPEHRDSRYNGMLSSVDESVRDVHKALVDSGLEPNTLLIFSSDNGADKDFATPKANGQLMGYKGTFMEGGIRVPAFVTGGFLPRKARGKRLSGIFGIQDWFSTLMHLADVNLKHTGPTALDSVDMWSYLSGDHVESPRDRLIIHIGEEGDTITARYKHFKLIAQDPVQTPHVANFVVESFGGRACSFQKPCLFDLHQNIGESVDVSSKRIDIIKEIKNWLIADFEANALSRALIKKIPAAASTKWRNYACNIWKPAHDQNRSFIQPWATTADEESFLKSIPRSLPGDVANVAFFAHRLPF